MEILSLKQTVIEYTVGTVTKGEFLYMTPKQAQAVPIQDKSCHVQQHGATLGCIVLQDMYFLPNVLFRSLYYQPFVWPKKTGCLQKSERGHLLLVRKT